MEEKNKEKELILCSLLDAALHAEPHVENQAALKQKWERLKQQETEWESILSIADRHRVLPLLYDVLENILPEDGADWKKSAGEKYADCMAVLPSAFYEPVCDRSFERCGN